MSGRALTPGDMCQGHQGKGITGHWPLVSLGHLAPRHRVTGGAGGHARATSECEQTRLLFPSLEANATVLYWFWLFFLPKLKNFETAKHLWIQGYDAEMIS